MIIDDRIRNVKLLISFYTNVMLINMTFHTNYATHGYWAYLYVSRDYAGTGDLTLFLPSLGQGPRE